MEKLGIEPSLLVAQIVNFVIIVVFLNVLLYKPILKMLEKRKKKIEEGLDLTEKMRAEWEKMEMKKTKLMNEAKNETIKLIDEAKKQAKAEQQEILEETRKKAEEILEKAKKEIEEQKNMMEKQVRKDAVDIAVALAKRLLSQIMTNDLQHEVIKKHLKDLESVK